MPVRQPRLSAYLCGQDQLLFSCSVAWQFSPVVETIFAAPRACVNPVTESRLRCRQDHIRPVVMEPLRQTLLTNRTSERNVSCSIFYLSRLSLIARGCDTAFSHSPWHWLALRIWTVYASHRQPVTSDAISVSPRNRWGWFSAPSRSHTPSSRCRPAPGEIASGHAACSRESWFGGRASRSQRPPHSIMRLCCWLGFS